MEEEPPVALAVVTQPQLDMLGSSLKVIFKVDDGEEQFSNLLRALDDPAAAKTILAELATRECDK